MVSHPAEEVIHELRCREYSLRILAGGIEKLGLVSLYRRNFRVEVVRDIHVQGRNECPVLHVEIGVFRSMRGKSSGF